ncbi:hypothetical protein HK097_008394 [Rhizophlyctis rosea]|uniref:Uncharacterized protein n=1 Tax=Rhizophlyctis rosea TaxID=64517 RepID=A0AAD5SDI2_9FUNG|nr:hypothetical protein HK097_008394 [Rhizophlyctis rosea]
MDAVFLNASEFGRIPIDVAEDAHQPVFRHFQNRDDLSSYEKNLEMDGDEELRKFITPTEINILEDDSVVEDCLLPVLRSYNNEDESFLYDPLSDSSILVLRCLVDDHEARTSTPFFKGSELAFNSRNVPSAQVYRELMQIEKRVGGGVW